MSGTLPVMADRMCRPRALDNPLRRRLSPAMRDLDLLSPAPGETVADLGAGVGYFVPEILRRLGPGGRLYLVDIDAENLEIARRRAGPDPRVEVLVRSAAEVDSIPSESVDRVLLSLVLCCLVDKERTMDQVWRVLKPGGRVLVTYPRRRLPLRRGPSLRVTPERWGGLLARHPWIELPAPKGWVVARHLLARPARSVT